METAMKNNHKKTIGLLLTGALLGCGTALQAADSPSADDILKSFEESSAANAPASDEMLSFRGIRMKDADAENGCGVPKGTVSLRVRFSVNSYNIEPEGYDTLKEMAKAMTASQLANCTFIVEGHTDASGNASYNRQLSEKRAMAVKNFLVFGGVDGSRLTTVGKGEDEPLNPANPNAAENRRVQFRVADGTGN